MFYGSIYFQNHFEKSQIFNNEKAARGWLDFESAITDNVREYKLYELGAEGWRLVDTGFAKGAIYAIQNNNN